MSQNDDLYRSRTPSGWHDDAQHRDAGHDEMQAAVWRWLSTQEGERDGDLTWVQVEYPFIARERYGTRIVAFGDVVAYSRSGVYLIYEVKPIIHSVGAVIRQLSAIEHAFSRITDRHSGRPYPCVVRAVVPAHDPKLKLLGEMSRWGVVVWHAAAGRPVT